MLQHQHLGIHRPRHHWPPHLRTAQLPLLVLTRKELLLLQRRRPRQLPHHHSIPILGLALKGFFRCTMTICFNYPRHHCPVTTRHNHEEVVVEPQVEHDTLNTIRMREILMLRGGEIWIDTVVGPPQAGELVTTVLLLPPRRLVDQEKLR